MSGDQFSSGPAPDWGDDSGEGELDPERTFVEFEPDLPPSDLLASDELDVDLEPSESGERTFVELEPLDLPPPIPEDELAANASTATSLDVPKAPASQDGDTSLGRVEDTQASARPSSSGDASAADLAGGLEAVGIDFEEEGVPAAPAPVPARAPRPVPAPQPVAAPRAPVLEPDFEADFEGSAEVRPLGHRTEVLGKVEAPRPLAPQGPVPVTGGLPVPVPGLEASVLEGEGVYPELCVRPVWEEYARYASARLAGGGLEGDEVEEVVRVGVEAIRAALRSGGGAS